jgi:hypothetical protein
MIMKTMLSFAALRCCSLGLVGLLAASLAPAQNSATPPKYRMLTLAYMKTAPGKAADYVKLEREVWKPVHQDMVDNGRLTSWKLYSVTWPNGEGEEYDFVTMMEYPNFALMETPYAATDGVKILGEAKFARLQNETGLVRTMRRSDTLTIVLATDSWATAENRVLSVHFLRSLPGKGEDLMKIQGEYFLPLNQESSQAGRSASWATTAVRYPRDIDHPYDYVSFNGFARLGQMETEAPQAFRDKWGGARQANMSAQLAASRKRVKGQLWSLEEQTTPRQAR